MERADMAEVDVTTLAPEDVKMLLERASHDDAEACYTLSRYYAVGKNKNANKSLKVAGKGRSLGSSERPYGRGKRETAQ